MNFLSLDTQEAPIVGLSATGLASRHIAFNRSVDACSHGLEQSRAAHRVASNDTRSSSSVGFSCGDVAPVSSFVAVFSVVRFSAVATPAAAAAAAVEAVLSAIGNSIEWNADWCRGRCCCRRRRLWSDDSLVANRPPRSRNCRRIGSSHDDDGGGRIRGMSTEGMSILKWPSM
jgi:hypothetical protein